MKKTRFVLKASLFAFAMTVLSMASFAQNAEKKPNVPAVQQKNINSSTPMIYNPAARGASSVANPKQYVQRKPVATVSRTGSPARSCTPKARTNPYSITRATFNKLPLSRQQFVLNHSDKYTIVD